MSTAPGSTAPEASPRNRESVVAVRGNPTLVELAALLVTMGRRRAVPTADPYRAWRTTRRAVQPDAAHRRNRDVAPGSSW